MLFLSEMLFPTHAMWIMLSGRSSNVSSSEKPSPHHVSKYSEPTCTHLTLCAHRPGFCVQGACFERPLHSKYTVFVEIYSFGLVWWGQGRDLGEASAHCQACKHKFCTLGTSLAQAGLNPRWGATLWEQLKSPKLFQTPQVTPLPPSSPSNLLYTQQKELFSPKPSMFTTCFLSRSRLRVSRLPADISCFCLF